MPALHVMIKPASNLCNLRCSYCFYADVAHRRETVSFGVMKETLLEKLVRRAFVYAQGQVSFTFQGGEPTVAGKEFFRNFLMFVRRYRTQGTQVNCAIQTNGTLLDQEWMDIFREGRFLVGVSIDGTKELHDRCRQTADGSPTYDLVMEKTRLLQVSGIDYNILCVVNRPVALNGREVFENLRPHGYLQFIPCLDDFDGKLTENSLRPGDYGHFLCDTFPLYEAAWQSGKPVSVRTFDNWIGMLMGFSPESCAMFGRCGNYYLIEADGSTYPCDFYVLDEWKLGNIDSDSFFRLEKSEVGRRFRELSLQVDEKCRNCGWYFLCRGGCRREREPMIKDILSLNRLCGDLLMFFDKYGKRMETLARRIARQRGMNPDQVRRM
jgi:uncharacterized protein